MQVFGIFVRPVCVHVCYSVYSCVCAGAGWRMPGSHVHCLRRLSCPAIPAFPLVDTPGGGRQALFGLYGGVCMLALYSHFRMFAMRSVCVTAIALGMRRAQMPLRCLEESAARLPLNDACFVVV